MGYEVQGAFIEGIRFDVFLNEFKAYNIDIDKFIEDMEELDLVLCDDNMQIRDNYTNYYLGFHVIYIEEGDDSLQLTFPRTNDKVIMRSNVMFKTKDTEYYDFVKMIFFKYNIRDYFSMYIS